MAMRGEHAAVAGAVRGAHQTPTGWLRVHCPLCPERVGKQDRSFSLAVHPGSWFYRCWRCHVQGRLPGAPDGSEQWEVRDVEEGQFFLGPPDDYVPLTATAGTLAFGAARAFLHRRRVPEQTWAEAGIGAALHGRAACRIVVPVFAPGGVEWLGWVGRAWQSSAELRYLYPPGMKRGACLYNAGALDVATDAPLFVVEGVFDALPHWPHAVACLGKPTEDQIGLLVATKRPVIVALDGDAWTEGEALAWRLQLEGVRAAALRLPPCTDPGDLSVDELQGMARLLGAA